MSNQSFKVKSGLTLTPVDSTTLVSPQSGDIICDINDSNKLKRWNGSTWVEIGSGGGATSSDYIIDQYISKTNNSTSALGLIYKRVQSATSLTSFQALMIDKSVPTSGNLTFDIKVGELPYNLTTRFNGTVYAVDVQSDGSVFVGGAFTTYNGKAAAKFVKLKSNGNIDSSFSIGTGFDDIVYAIKVLGDGSVLVGGLFNSYNSNTAYGLCKLTSTGAIDNTFTSNGTRQIAPGVTDRVADIKVRPNGKILVCGSFTTSGFPQVAKGLIQLNADGSLDTGFAVGNGTNANKMAIMPDDSLFVVGDFTQWNSILGINGIIKFDSVGVRDTVFNSGSGFTATTPFVNSIAVHQGDIIVVGEFNQYNGVSSVDLVKINATTGAKDTNTVFASLNSGASANDVKVLPDDKILVVGNFTSYNAIARRYIVKINADGSIDSSFTSPITSAFQEANCLQIHSNGKIVVGGDFTTVTSVTGASLAQLLSTGVADTTFDILVSIFNTLPSFNFASVSNGDILSGVIARPSIPAGGYIKIDITVIPSTYVGNFYLTLY